MSSIKSRVILGLSLIVVFFMVQAALVWSTRDRLRDDVVDVTRRNTLATVALSELAVLAQQVRRYEKEYFVYVGNETRRNGYIKEWTQTHDHRCHRPRNIDLRFEQGLAPRAAILYPGWQSGSAANRR